MKTLVILLQLIGVALLMAALVPLAIVSWILKQIICALEWARNLGESK